MPLRAALSFLCMVAFDPRGASAVPYEIFIDAETENDLYELLATGQISERSFDALLLLHQTRVNLNQANREALYVLPNLSYAHVDRLIEYRREAGAIGALGELVTEGVLSVEVAASLEPFVLVRTTRPSKPTPKGFVRAQSRWSGRYDRLPPASSFQARVQAAHGLDSGVVATLTRTRVRRIRWDPSRQALSVAPERARIEVPKAYVEWKTRDWEVVAGTYRIGFGQRLTFDVTDQVSPNGLFGDYELRRSNELGLACKRRAGERVQTPCPSNRAVRITPDFSWTNRLSGVAAGVKRLPVGSGWLQGYVWGSYQLHRARRVELVSRATCNDPAIDVAGGCGAPPVYLREGASSEPANTLAHATLPAVFTEGLGGTQVGYYWSDRRHLGFVAYGAVPRWRVQGAMLDFRNTARRPRGGPYGAIGLHAAYGWRRQDLFVEVARSFDRQGRGRGGYGAIVRSITSLSAGELDLSARYYGTAYANPYARPISAPDEHEGLRARDETGLKVRAVLRAAPRLGIRLQADGWRELSSGPLRGLLSARLDWNLTGVWSTSTWVELRSAARQVLSAAQIRYAPVARVALWLQAQHRRLDAWAGPRRPQHDLSATLQITGRPLDRFDLRARVRWELRDVSNNHRLPHVLWAYLQASLATRERDVLRARYDLRAFLDQRESTAVRLPNPEHWLSLEYVFRY